MNLQRIGSVIFLSLLLPMPAYAREWPSTTAAAPFWFFLFIWIFVGIQIRKSSPSLIFPEISWMSFFKLIVLTEGLVILDTKLTTVPKIPAAWIIFLISICGYFLFFCDFEHPGRRINLSFHGTFLFLALFFGLKAKLEAFDQAVWTGTEWKAVEKWSFLPALLEHHWDWDVFLWYLGIFFCVFLILYRGLNKNPVPVAGPPG